MGLESLLKLPADEAMAVQESFSLGKLGKVAEALQRLGLNPTAQAKLVQFVFTHPEVFELVAKLAGVLFSHGAQNPAAPVPAPVPPPSVPLPVLVWPTECDLRIGSIDHDDEQVPFTLDGEGVVRPRNTTSVDDNSIVRLEPFWGNADGGITIAAADDEEGPNAHLRWRQRVVCEYGKPALSRVVEGGLGRPDESQDTDERSFVRMKRYNETRGQVIPVRLGAKGGPYRMHVEMDTPNGVVRSNVITVAEVR